MILNHGTPAPAKFATGANLIPLRPTTPLNANLRCSCGSEWFAVDAVVLDALDGHVTGYTPTPPTCHDCGKSAAEITARFA